MELMYGKSNKNSRLRFDSSVMTQFDRHNTVARPRIGRAILAVVLAAGVVAGLVWGISNLRFPMRKAKGDSVARAATVLLTSLKTGNLDQAMEVTAESEAGRKAIADDDEQHAKPNPPTAQHQTKTQVAKQDSMTPRDFLSLTRDLLAKQGVTWEQIKPLAFGGMQANVLDVRHMKDPSIAVVGDVYFASNDQVYTFEISARCCGDNSYFTDFWRCAKTDLKPDAPLNVFKERTAERLRSFVEEPIKPGERVGITKPRIVFVSMKEEPDKH
jgi:hypothetical protein